MDKKKNLFLFFCKMVILTVIVMFATQIIPMILADSVLNYKYGTDFIAELFMALVILIVMLIFKNQYVFTEKKEKFWKSLLVGTPILVVAFIILVVNSISIKEVTLPNFINLVLFSFSIGLAEELMCRGWIQNEFIERFGSNRKQVITSICLSGLVFGFLHLTNMFAGQGVFETLMQVLQTTSIGILLGAIYYRTKNIWSVIFMHGFYDLAIMLGDVNLLRDCSVNTVISTEMQMYNLVMSLILVAYYILSAVVILRKTKVNQLVEEKEHINVSFKNKENKLNKIIYVVLGLLLIISFIPVEPEGYEDYSVCYEYESKKIEEYTMHYQSRDEYKMYFVKDNIDLSRTIYEYVLFMDEETGEVGIEDKTLNEKYMSNGEYIYQYEVIENIDSYIILMFGNNDAYGSTVYYGVVQKNELTEDGSFIKSKIEKLEEYKLPTINDIGYLTYGDEDYNYPLMISTVGDKFIIDETGSLFVLSGE